MQTYLYFQCFAVALTGWALHTSLKLRSLQVKSKAANLEFKVKDYFYDDWLVIVSCFLTIILFLLFIDEVFNINEKIIDYVKIGFGFVGYTGSDVASRLFSLADKKINTVIDYKTNIADGIEQLKS
jgi:hypothetical protein